MSQNDTEVNETTSPGAIPDIVFKVVTTVLSITLLGIGGWMAFQGIIYYIEAYYPGTFDLFIFGGGGGGTMAFQALLADSAIMRIFTGGLVCTSGGLMFTRKKWAMSIGVVSCAFILVQTLPSTISLIAAGNPSFFLSWPALITCTSLGISVFGIVWLAIAHKNFV